MPMILEHALLAVITGREEAFLATFVEARPLIASRPGFRSVGLCRSVERPSVFLLLVEWEQLTDQTVGFRGSPEYQRWKALLHPFYKLFPDVGHFTDV